MHCKGCHNNSKYIFCAFRWSYLPWNGSIPWIVFLSLTKANPTIWQARQSFGFHFFLIVQHCIKVACRRRTVKITKRFLQITIKQWCLIKIFIFIFLESTKMFLHKFVGARRFLSARLAVNISNYLVHDNPLKFLKLLTHVSRDMSPVREDVASSLLNSCVYLSCVVQLESKRIYSCQ